MLPKLLRKFYEGNLSSLIIFFYLGIQGQFLVGIIPTAPVSTGQDTTDDSLVMSRSLMSVLLFLGGSIWNGQNNLLFEL